MSSPFAVFRKNQKAFLVVFGVLIMFAFTVGPILLKYFGGDGPSSRINDQLVVSWADGNLRVNEINSMISSHNQAAQFLNAVDAEARRLGGAPKAMGIPRMSSERDLMQTLVMAKKAQSMGITVSDEAINAYINQISDEMLSQDDLEKIFEESTYGKISFQTLFDNLRASLLSQQLQMLITSGLSSVSPSEAWEYHNRLHRRVQLEFFPLQTEDFIEKVSGQPTESEIEKLYKELINSYQHPDIPDFGLRRLNKIQFQYAKADFNAFFEIEKAKISEQEISEYYEKNKSIFIITELPSAEKEEKEAPKDEEDSAAPKPPEVKEKEKKENDKSPQTPKKDDQSSATIENFSFVSADDKKAKPDDKPNPETPSQENENKPGVEKENSAKAKKETAKKPNEEPAEKSPPPKYKPLEEVKEEILRNLASQPAQEKMALALKTLNRELTRHFKKVKRAEAASKESPTLDIAALAAKNNLIFGETPKLDAITLSNAKAQDSDDPLYDGLVETTEFSFAGGNFQQYRFVDIAYRDGIPLKTTSTIRGKDSEFIYWKIDEDPIITPTLNECTEDIVKAWRFRKAFELAKQEGKKLSEQAKQNQSLKEQFTDREVTESSEFSWITSGSTPMNMGQSSGPMLSTVPEVEYAGMEFMEAVFALENGEPGFAESDFKTTVYVVRIIKESPSEEVRRLLFLQSGASMDISQLARLESSRIIRQWYEDLEKEMRVEWHEVDQTTTEDY